MNVSGFARRHAAAVALAPLLLAVAGVARAADDAAADAAEVSGLTVIAPGDDAYRAENTSAATKTDTPLRDVPQAMTVVTDELIRDQAMQTMADVVRYVPGVTMGQGEGHRDAPTIRGNATTADFFIDGVRDDVQYFRDLYNVERVEVLKGPNAMIFGRGGGGGVINRVTKKADWSAERAVTVELGSWEHRRFTTDLAAPLNDGFAVRAVALYERSESFRDFVNLERWGVNPSIAWRNGSGLTVSLAYEHFEDDRTTDRGVPPFLGRPSPAPRSAFFGDPERSYALTNVDLLNLGVEYQVSETLILRHRTVYGDYDKYYANIFPGGAAVAGPTGAPATFPLQAYQNDSPRENLFSQTDIVWKPEFAGMRHTILAGFELGRQKTSNLRRTGHFNTVTGPTTLAGNPFSDPTRRGLTIFFTNTGGDANNRVKATVAAAYVQDQIEITPQLQVIAGLRYDSFDVDFFDRRASVTGRRDFSRQDDLWSPRLGVVFKPLEPVSLYASYSVSYLPSSGDQFSSLNATSETLEPEEFENLEAGLKWEINPNLLFTAALYRLDRENTTAPDPTRPGQVVLTGAQRTKGFEAGISGRITPQWEIAGGYAWQDAEITSTTSAGPAGRKVPLVPDHTFSLWNRYDFNDRFGAGVGVIHQTRMFASISNAVTLPGFTRVDAAVFVNVTETVRAQVNVENVFDKRYFPTSHGDSNILPGAPRAVRGLGHRALLSFPWAAFGATVFPDTGRNGMADGAQVQEFETLTYEKRGQVVVLTLNVPDRLNAIGRVMMAEAPAALEAARADDEVRCLVLTGAGRGFCAGADLTGAAIMQAGGPPTPASQTERIDEMGWVGRWATMWANFDKPVIGAINGVAAGAGLSTALACDVRIGSEHARFKSVFIERSLSPDSGLSYFLPRVVGYAAAADMIFTSRAVGADEALRIGLLNRLVPAAELVDAAVAYGEEMAQWPPLALRMSKRVLQQNQDADLADALRYESYGLSLARKAPNDAKESRLAFLEKRKGVYSGT